MDLRKHHCVKSFTPWIITDFFFKQYYFIYVWAHQAVLLVLCRPLCFCSQSSKTFSQHLMHIMAERQQTTIQSFKTCVEFFCMQVNGCKQVCIANLACCWRADVCSRHAWPGAQWIIKFVLRRSQKKLHRWRWTMRTISVASLLSHWFKRYLNGGILKWYLNDT